MANTVSVDALRREVWIKELFKDVKDSLFFTNHNMMGKDSNNVIQVKDELQKGKGDAITFGLTAKLSGAGIDGDSELEGNEEAISSYDEQVLIDQKRFAVRLTGQLDEQKAAYEMRTDAKDKLAIRLVEFLERQFFMKLGGVTETDLTDVNGNVYSADALWSNTPNIVPFADEAAGTGDRYICADASGVDSIAATDVLTTTLISRARVKAQLASPKIQPLRIGGQDHYVLFVHPWQAYDLKTNTSDVWAQAQREAQTRGGSNPIFSGALGIWDGVIIHEHEYVPTVQTSSDFSSTGEEFTARGFRSLLCGRQACVFAQAKNPKAFVEKEFDYENKIGFATGMIGGIQKPTFNSLDYGVITLDTSATVL
jgi:N4-gp56 family major capsid protein